MIENIYPSYLTSFKCKAQNCKHTCCRGWEIDIDEESLKRFKKDNIPNISEEDTPHFILKEGDICPFLRSDNLCQMIINHGEEYVCNICKDHPRFRNFWTGVSELGIGLSCEEAARIILTQNSPLKLVTDGKKSLEEYVSSLPEDEKYLWDIRQKILEEAAKLEDPMQARLAEYFAYRQIPDALYDGKLEERIAFVWTAVNEITKLWNNQEDQSEEALIETARAYSEYIEYNTERLNSKIDGN